MFLRVFGCVVGVSVVVDGVWFVCVVVLLLFYLCVCYCLSVIFVCVLCMVFVACVPGLFVCSPVFLCFAVVINWLRV